MVFCNEDMQVVYLYDYKGHNPYFNRWFSAIIETIDYIDTRGFVTILILIDGFLQFSINVIKTIIESSQSLF